MKAEIIDCVFSTDEPDDFCYTTRGLYIAKLGILFSERKIHFLKSVLSTEDFAPKTDLYSGPTYPELKKVKTSVIPDCVARELKLLCGKIRESTKVQKTCKSELSKRLADLFDVENLVRD